jgi:hypothetical protein
MRGIPSLIALSAVLPLCCGCLSMPNVAHPGTEARQQARAQVFEPYPENEMGPPVVGSRPREYQDPRPAFAVLQDMHPNRAAGRGSTDPGLAPCPPSAAPVPQPPVVTAPPAIYYPPGMTLP